MSSSPACFHQVEWPAPGVRVRGPIVWLRGWVVGQAGHDFHDVRAQCGGQVHLGLLGLPRTDLAAHFKSARRWLPAEFVLGVPLADGAAEIFLEAQDAFGAWHGLQTLTVTVAPDGETSSREAGRLESQTAGSWTRRSSASAISRTPRRAGRGHRVGIRPRQNLRMVAAREPADQSRVGLNRPPSRPTARARRDR